MNARYVLVVAVVVMMAGCVTGGSGGDGPLGEGGEGTDAGSDAAGGDGGEDAAGGGGDVVAGEWEPFSFETPARYEYDVYIEGEGEGSLVWDVQSVSDGEYTVQLLYEMDGERFETTATGTKETVMGQLYSNPGAVVLMTTMYQPASWYQGRELSAGTQWSYSTPQGSASFAITGQDSIGDVDCWTSEMQINSTVVHDGCFSPALGLAPQAAWYGEDGDLEMSVTLASYEEN